MEYKTLRVEPQFVILKFLPYSILLPPKTHLKPPEKAYALSPKSIAPASGRLKGFNLKFLFGPVCISPAQTRRNNAAFFS